MGQLTREQLTFIANHLNYFTHTTSVDNFERNYIYECYNTITGENKKPNGCGRCWHNTKKKVYDQFLKQTNVF